MSKKLVVLSQSFKVQTSITQTTKLLFTYTLLLKHSDTNREIYLYLTHVSNVENASTGIKTSIEKKLSIKYSSRLPKLELLFNKSTYFVSYPSLEIGNTTRATA